MYIHTLCVYTAKTQLLNVRGSIHNVFSDRVYSNIWIWKTIYAPKERFILFLKIIYKKSLFFYWYSQDTLTGDVCLLFLFWTIWLPENLKFVELIPDETTKFFNIINYTAWSGFS